MCILTTESFDLIIDERKTTTTTFFRCAILKERGIDIIPDILANSGGVVVSYYEWLQNKRCEYWTEEQVLNKLTKQMKLTFDKIYNQAKERNLSMRDICYIYSYKKIESVILKKQIF